ncbi:hypothetical protein CYMTET_45738 [Cymbomonas tetramitiformis]|uniref:Uncharacterized protein n=1 Tax=Cymbomonas tetramitiformis TaxID=36881 RepID=A0AAE0EZE0_9CHLO|nr:hypothetical protein CYMTET_45738 [Cymbomonas tetramitiformis]
MPGPGVGASGRISSYTTLANSWKERVGQEQRATQRFNDGGVYFADGSVSKGRSECSHAELLEQVQNMEKKLEDEKTERRKLEAKFKALS